MQQQPAFWEYINSSVPLPNQAFSGYFHSKQQQQPLLKMNKLIFVAFLVLPAVSILLKLNKYYNWISHQLCHAKSSINSCCILFLIWSNWKNESCNCTLIAVMSFCSRSFSARAPLLMFWWATQTSPPWLLLSPLPTWLKLSLEVL